MQKCSYRTAGKPHFAPVGLAIKEANKNNCLGWCCLAFTHTDLESQAPVTGYHRLSSLKLQVFPPSAGGHKSQRQCYWGGNQGADKVPVACLGLVSIPFFFPPLSWTVVRQLRSAWTIQDNFPISTFCHIRWYLQLPGMGRKGYFSVYYSH